MLRKTNFKRRISKAPSLLDKCVNTLMETEGLKLVGSRFMLKQFEEWVAYADHLREEYDWSNVDKADWDFIFDEESDDYVSIVNTLKDLGFVQNNLENTNDYDEDAFLGPFWKHPKFPIEIIGKFSFNAINQVWTTLRPDFYYKYLWKSAPHRLEEGVEEHKKFIGDWFDQSVQSIEDVTRELTRNQTTIRTFTSPAYQPLGLSIGSDSTTDTNF